jgi:hypothetical protein
MQKYTPLFFSYNVAQSIPTNCNSITFINLGTTLAIVENVTIQPTQSFAIDGNSLEFTEGTLQINFSGVGNNNLVVVKKIYSEWQG